MRRTRRDSRAIVVLVTCPSPAVARRLADRIVGARLAACVNILSGVASTFWWEGKVDRCREALLVVKTTTGAFGRLERAICALHPYEVPEIIALAIVAGHAPYLRWIRATVQAQPSA